MKNTVIDLKFGRHKDLSTLKSDIRRGIEAFFVFWVDKSSFLPQWSQ